MQNIAAARSALDGAGGHAFDDVLLAGEVEHHHGDDAGEDQCHGGAQVHGAVTAFQILDVDGDGHVLGTVQHQVGQQVVVPDPHDFQNTHGDHGGLEHGQHHAEVGAQGAAAVNGRRFLNFQGNTLDEAGEHEHRQARAQLARFLHLTLRLLLLYPSALHDQGFEADLF